MLSAPEARNKLAHPEASNAKPDGWVAGKNEVSPGGAAHPETLRLELPLVTVGAIADECQHDWVRIFSSLGVLPHAIQIGNFTRLLAWAGMVGTLAWFGWKIYAKAPQPPELVIAVGRDARQS
jgi:hypothetical protein